MNSSIESLEFIQSQSSLDQIAEVTDSTFQKVQEIGRKPAKLLPRYYKPKGRKKKVHKEVNLSSEELFTIA
jgi:hypothetical protein